MASIAGLSGRAWWCMNIRSVTPVAVAWAAVLVLFILPGCNDKTSDGTHEKVTISGRAYTLELALDLEKRQKGLSEREVIPDGTGMLFVFPDREVRVQEFVMRDCRIPIDIIFLDRSGRVTATHAMKVEEARRPDEPKPENPRVPDPYEARLKRYSSRYAAQFVIELAGGELDKLKLSEGQKIPLDLDGLKKRAR
ncbi:MAG: DUF192 domain-containing protein [Phycisphaeraceae bacterium]|nr:DUF192 domain-containing protein [Phycisphaerae bacterium]MBX3393321.1 DUF192 domain-containing protein [Phycisphaeraceae bacterium]HRJ49209.1 DUF192 domain-containing protein [Phycisphaerales bacterium]